MVECVLSALMIGVSKRSYILTAFYPPKSDEFYDFSLLAAFLKILLILAITKAIEMKTVSF